jgi:micrococcal nuclease
VRRLILTLLLVALAAFGGRAVLTPPEDGEVTRVVDGDTLHVQVDGRDETVRLLGIDTPELHRPDTPVECGARAASHSMEELADGRRVDLVTDPSQDQRDRYGRLLAYAVTRGGVDLGEAIVRRGWAEVYVYDGPFQRLARYRAAAAAARRADRGVSARCGGDFHSAS